MNRLLLSLSILGLAAGCEQLPEIPLTDDASESTDEAQSAAETPATTPAAEPAKPATPAEKIAAFQAKPSTQLTAEDVVELTSLSSGLDQIQEINLKGSRLNAEAMAALGKLTNLQQLNLHAASFGGGSLEAVSGLSQLNLLDVSRTATNNAEMAAIGKLTSLRKLMVAQTVITDDGVAQLTQLSSLEELDISSTETVGLGLAALGTKGAKAPLKVLRAAQTRCGAQGFRVVNQFQLEELHVPNALVTDASLTGLKGCNELKILDVSHNQITDAGTKPLQALKSLETLNLARNQGISDATLRRLVSLPNLKQLDLSKTACSLQAIQVFKKRNPECAIQFEETTY